jgi:hypothetical protein
MSAMRRARERGGVSMFMSTAGSLARVLGPEKSWGQ